MSRSLIGHTGFVGGNLARQVTFDRCYNSQNIDSIAGSDLELLVISGAPAAKWIANRDPQADLANIQRLIDAIKQVKARQTVLISTVDVYVRPLDVDEESPIDRAAQQPYGKHRLILEDAIRSAFPTALILRLPGLFGPGLKKNAIFDIFHNNEIHKIHSGGSFQFYSLDTLWADIQTALAAEIRLLNVATEPFTVGEMAREAFGLHFDNQLATPPARYDFRSKHAELFGGRNGYLFDRARVMGQLKDFVASQKRSV